MIVNRGGGSFDESVAAELEGLFAAAGVEADVRLVEPGRLHDEFAEAAGAAGLGAVVAAGGDGTISCAAGALAGSDRPLGILSFGTLNHFARDAGLPADVKEAVAAIAGGRTRQVDVAEVNGRVFINNSAVGMYPKLVRDREAQQRHLGRGKKLAMLIAAGRSLWRFSHHRLTLRIAGREAPVETPSTSRVARTRSTIHASTRSST